VLTQTTSARSVLDLATDALAFFDAAVTPAELTRSISLCDGAFVALQMENENGFAPAVCRDLLAAIKGARAELAAN
jgi:hypothetical protein